MTDHYPGRREQTEADSRIRRPRELRAQRRQRGAHGLARGLARARASARSSKRSPLSCAAWCAWSTKVVSSTCGRGRRLSPFPGSGFATAVPKRMAQNTSLYVCRPSRRTPFIAIRNSDMRLAAVLLVVFAVACSQAPPPPAAARVPSKLEGMWSDPPPTAVGTFCFFSCTDAGIERLNALLDDPSQRQPPVPSTCGRGAEVSAGHLPSPPADRGGAEDVSARPGGRSRIPSLRAVGAVEADVCAASTRDPPRQR